MPAQNSPIYIQVEIPADKNWPDGRTRTRRDTAKETACDRLENKIPLCTICHAQAVSGKSHVECGCDCHSEGS